MAFKKKKALGMGKRVSFENGCFARGKCAGIASDAYETFLGDLDCLPIADTDHFWTTDDSFGILGAGLHTMVAFAVDVFLFMY